MNSASKTKLHLSRYRYVCRPGKIPWTHGAVRFIAHVVARDDSFPPFKSAGECGILAALAGAVHRLVVAVCLGALFAPGPGLAAADAPWQRTAPIGVPSGECRELVIDRPGDRFLELRLATERLESIGIDTKNSGASVFVPESGDRATILLYHTSGLYPLTIGLDGPLRLFREGRRLCFASGSRMSACGVTNGEVRHAHLIPFGRGWESRVAPCLSPLAVPESARSPFVLAPLWVLFAILFLLQVRYRERVAELIPAVVLVPVLAWATAARIDPWWIDPRYPLTTLALVAVWSLIRLARTRSAVRVCLVALSLTCLAGAMLIPYPLWPSDTARVIDDPAAPPLWVDAAYWHYLAPQQRLQFATRSVASLLDADDDTWIVLGGSVTAGRETGAAEAFTAMAEQDLIADGYEIRLANAGVPGWNLGQIDRFLVDVGDQLPLTGIVLASVLNNAAFRIVGPPEPPGCRTLLCQYTYNLRRNYLLAAVINFFLPKPGNPERFRETVDRTISRERDLGREIVLLDETHDAQLRPRWYNSWLRRPQERYRRILREVAAGQGQSLHRVDDVVADLPGDDRFVDGMHLTKDAHAAVGRKLAQIVRGLKRED